MSELNTILLLRTLVIPGRSVHGERVNCKGVQRSALCRSRRELSNAYFLAKFGFDTAENEPSKVCRIPRRRRCRPPIQPGPIGVWGTGVCRELHQASSLATSADYKNVYKGPVDCRTLSLNSLTYLLDCSHAAFLLLAMLLIPLE